MIDKVIDRDQASIGVGLKPKFSAELVVRFKPDTRLAGPDLICIGILEIGPGHKDTGKVLDHRGHED